MPDRPWKDEYTLLCEKCGYVIEGIDTEGNCPECGLAINQSLPRNRRTFEWYGYTNLPDLFRMGFLTLRKPRWLLEHTKVHADISADLRSYWVGIAIVLLGLSATIAQALEEGSYLVLLLLPLTLLNAWIHILLFSWLGRIIFAFLAKLRGKRMHEELSKTICNYACIGWVITSFGGVIVLPAIVIAERSGWNSWLNLIYAFGVGVLILGLLYMIFFLWMGYRYAGFANQHKAPRNG